MRSKGWKTGRFGRGTGFDMIFKIVTLFLIVMGVLAMFGKWRVPGADMLRRLGGSRPRTCKHCGRYQIGKGPCDCRKVKDV